MRDSNLPSKFFFLLSISLISLFTSGKAIAFGGPPGGPFGNGSYFPTEGTFQATIRAVNLSGVATFNSIGAKPQSSTPTSGADNATSNSTGLSGAAGGTFAVSYQGSTYSGNVDGSINPAGGSIAAVLEGSSGTGGSGNATQTVVNTLNSVFGVIGTRNVDGGTSPQTVQETIYEIVDGGTNWTTVNQTRAELVPADDGRVITLQQNVTDIDTVTTQTTDSNGNVTTTTTTTTNNKITLTEQPVLVTQNITETVAREFLNPKKVETFTVNKTLIVDNPDTLSPDNGWIDTIGTTTFSNALYASGFFNARLKNSFPNQVFKGDGSMSFSQVNEVAVPPVLAMVDVPIKVRGVRISNSTQSYTAKAVQKPTVVTSTVVENRP